MQRQLPPQLRLAVYVIHSARLAGRMKNVELLRSVLGSSQQVELKSFEILGEHDAEVLGESSLRELTDVTTKGVTGAPGAPFDRLLAPMHVSQVSNALKHHDALTRVASFSSDPGVYHLVVEDDVLFNEKSLVQGLTDSLQKAPSDCGLLFLGLPSSKPVESEPEAQHSGVRFEALDHFFSFFNIAVLPACDSYIVSPFAATRLVQGFLPIRFPTHIHLSWCLREAAGQQSRRVQAHIASPNVFLDGSKLGIFTSSLTQNNRLAWNPAYMEINALVRRPQPLTDAEVERIEGLRARMSLRDNPDIRFLFGLYHAKCGRYSAAAVEMRAAFDAYRQNGCVLSRSSEFVNRFCDLHVHLQEEEGVIPPSPAD